MVCKTFMRRFDSRPAPPVYPLHYQSVNAPAPGAYLRGLWRLPFETVIRRRYWPFLMYRDASIASVMEVPAKRHKVRMVQFTSTMAPLLWSGGREIQVSCATLRSATRKMQPMLHGQQTSLRIGWNRALTAAKHSFDACRTAAA